MDGTNDEINVYDYDHRKITENDDALDYNIYAKPRQERHDSLYGVNSMEVKDYDIYNKSSPAVIRKINPYDSKIDHSIEL